MNLLIAHTHIRDPQPARRQDIHVAAAAADPKARLAADRPQRRRDSLDDRQILGESLGIVFMGDLDLYAAAGGARRRFQRGNHRAHLSG